MSKFILVFLLFIQNIFPDNTLKMRKVVPSDYFYQPYSDEGYFQGWNFSFYNKDFFIFLTAIVSNLGPNSLNNGISISIESQKIGSFVITKEFGEKSLIASKDKFLLDLEKNIFRETKGGFEVNIETDKIKLYLEYKYPFRGPTLSGEKHVLEEGKFVKADIPFSFTLVKGKIEYKGEVYEISGIGGMEHLLTNKEVYKYSYSWEILRSYSHKSGNRFFTGGYKGKGEKFFRTISIQDKYGKIILSDTIKKSEILETKKDSFSGYTLPIKEKIYLDEEGKCSFTIDYLNPVGRIKVLDNISTVLSFFIKLFFANPYIIIHNIKVESDCPSKLQKETIFYGTKSDYLINSK